MMNHQRPTSPELLQVSASPLLLDQSTQTDDTPVAVGEYGPWTIGPLLFRDKNNTIYRTADSAWVLKVHTTRRALELSNILRLTERGPPPCMITVPDEAYRLYGTSPSGSWFAMRRYEGGHLTVERHAAAWPAVGRSCLAFLSDLHHSHRLVHGDIKLENILSDGHGAFVVSDYELMTTPDPRRLRDWGRNYVWYYILMGGELDAPPFSYKMDLLAVAYMLIHLAWMPSIARPSFRGICIRHREANDPWNYEGGAAAVVAQRNAEIRRGAPSVLVDFLDTIERTHWMSAEPPPRPVYELLDALLSTVSV